MNQHAHRSRNAQGKEGFTMVVIAALFIAFAVIAAVAVERNTTIQLISKRDAAAAQLTRLSNAIIEYGIFNQSGSTLLYPCPALENVLTNSGAFGSAVTNCWDPTGDVAGSPGSTVSGLTVLNGGSTDIIRGMVPVQTLSQYGIGINDAFDPWNNRIEYVVNRRLTLGSTTSAGAQTNNPSVTDPYTGLSYPKPDFILISYGRDGLGGIRRGATGVQLACPVTGTVLRQYNCDADSNFYMTPTYTVSSAGSSTYFDDLISFHRQ